MDSTSPLTLVEAARPKILDAPATENTGQFSTSSTFQESATPIEKHSQSSFHLENTCLSLSMAISSLLSGTSHACVLAFIIVMKRSNISAEQLPWRIGSKAQLLPRHVWYALIAIFTCPDAFLLWLWLCKVRIQEFGQRGPDPTIEV